MTDEIKLTRKLGRRSLSYTKRSLKTSRKKVRPQTRN